MLRPEHRISDIETSSRVPVHGTFVLPDAETTRHRNAEYATLFQRHGLVEVREGRIAVERVEDGSFATIDAYRSCGAANAGCGKASAASP